MDVMAWACGLCVHTSAAFGVDGTPSTHAHAHEVTLQHTIARSHSHAHRHRQTDRETPETISAALAVPLLTSTTSLVSLLSSGG